MQEYDILTLYVGKECDYMERLYPRFVVVHHTAGFDVSALTINRYHAERGFGKILRSPESLVAEYIRRGFKQVAGGVMVSIGYHYLIRANGTVEKGRPDFMQGAHCKAQNMNFSSIGVALTGNFDSRDNPRGAKGHTVPTSEQMAALRKLVLHLMDIYQIPREQVLGHKNIKNSATSCPGDRFDFKV